MAVVESTKLARKPTSKSSRSIWRLTFQKVRSTKPPEDGCAIFSREFQKKAMRFRFRTRLFPALRLRLSRWHRRRRRRANCTWITRTIRKKSTVLKETRTIKSPILISMKTTRHLPPRRRHQTGAYRN